MTTTIEDRFVAVVGRLDVPDVDLAPSIVHTLAADERSARPSSSSSWFAPRPAYVLVACALVALAVLLIAPAREAVADFFGIGRTKIEQSDDPLSAVDDRSVDFPTTIVGPVSGAAPATSEAAPTSFESAPEFADQLLEDVGRVVLSRLGPPDDTIIDDVRGRSYLWASNADLPAILDSEVGLVVSVRPVVGPVSVKGLGSDQRSEVVILEASEGPIAAAWIDGEHLVTFADGLAPLRADSVLLWAPASLEYRLESDLPRAEVERLAMEVIEGTDPFRAG